MGMDAKLHNIMKYNQYYHWFWDRLIFNKIKTVLGGNVKFMLSGSAPMSDEVKNFFKICMGCPML